MADIRIRLSYDVVPVFGADKTTTPGAVNMSDPPTSGVPVLK